MNSFLPLILVIEDAVSLREFIASTLTENHINVLLAGSGNAALEIIEEQNQKNKPVDVILLDLLLPGMSGFELLNQMQNHSQWKDICIIVISALDSVEDKVRALSLGAADYITKPFRPAELLARVENQLRIKHLSEELRKSERRYRILASSSPAGIFHCDLKGCCTFVNERWSEITGIGAEDAQGSGWENCFHPDDRAAILAHWEQAIKQNPGGLFTFEERIIHPNGATLWVLCQMSSEQDEKGNLLGFIGTLSDMTSRHQTEINLNEAAERLKNIIDNNQAGYFFIDHQGIFRQVNQAWLSIHKYDNPDEIIGKHFSTTMIYTKLKEFSEISDFLLAGNAIHSNDFSHRCKDGSIGYHAFFAAPVQRHKTIIGFEGFLVDITEIKLMERRLQTSLEEKEILLREVHHRVKNNMQVISSLLNLQAAASDNPLFTSLIKDSLNRIRAMANIQDQLYHSEHLALVNMADYFSSLFTPIRQAYNASFVKIALEADGIQLDADTAVLCGLITTELVSNAIKYAFPNPQEQDPPPLVKISLARAGSQSNSFKLVIRDNGCGLPESMDILAAPTLGLRLVSMLVEQMQGTLKYFNQAGAVFEIILVAQPKKVQHKGNAS